MRVWLILFCILVSSSSSFAGTKPKCESALRTEQISAEVEGWLKLDLIKNERLVIKFAPDVSADEIISVFEDAARFAQDTDARVLVVLEKRQKLGVLANQQTIMLLLNDPRIVWISFDPSHGDGQSGSSVGN